jgi:hypothetical protein
MKFLLAILLFVSSQVSAQTGSYLLYDYDLDMTQVSYNMNEVRSIASITKLFTAITILRSGEDLREKVKVTGKSSGRFARGSKVERMDLMRAMLISSDNLAAETLANTYPGGFKKYIQDVNEYAQGMGFVNTKLVDATGLLPGNVSTAKELTTFLWKIKDNVVIRWFANERHDYIEVPKGKKSVKIKLNNTNPSLFKVADVERIIDKSYLADIRDFDKLKANAINSVKKFHSDAKINNIDDNIETLLIEFNSIKEASYTKINIKDISSSFSKIKQSLKDAAEAAKAALEKAEAAKAAALDKAALEKAEAAKAAELEKAAAAAKAIVLFSNVDFAITKLNKEIDNVNANVAKFTRLKYEVEKLKGLDIAATEVKAAAEALKKAKAAPPAPPALAAAIRRVAAPPAPAAQTPENAQAALSAELKKIEPLLETAKTTLEEAYKLLENLRKSVIEQSDTLEKDKKDYLKSLDKLVALYSSYLKICTKNISRYDKLFEHNEISNIDEAFMIKSYSDFLKKLNKLKQNLETKDINKIRRALTDSINRLFNMYGVNTNNEAFMKAFLEGYLPNGKEDTKGTEGNDDKKTKDIDYIINRIINYNLAM